MLSNPTLNVVRVALVSFALLAGGACRSGSPDPASVGSGPRTGTFEPHASDVSASAPTPIASPSARAGRADGTASELERLLDRARRDNRALEHVRELTRDHPHRLTGSRGYDRAADWAVERFRAMGLDARLETWGEFPVAFDRGRQVGRIVSPREEVLTFATMAWTPGTKGPARGRAVLEPRTEEEFAALDPKEAFAGAWIVRREPKEGAKFRRMLREAYEEQGILGVVRAGAKNDWLTMGGSPPRENSETPKYVDVKLLASQHAALVTRLEAKEAIELEFDVENVFSPGPVSCANVVADWKGTKFPDEYVIVGAHLDAWDGAEGAQDNGTGVATALEAARLLSQLGLRTQRTVRFVLYGGEEQGLFGSKGYVRDHAAELARTSVVLTHDAGGTYLAGIDSTYSMMEDMRTVFGALTALDARFPFTIHEVDGLVNTGDSDHAPFIQAGVPSFFWHQSEKDYEYVHHTQHDVFAEIDPEQLRHSALVVAVAALGFGNLDHRLDRTDMEPIPRRRIGVQFEDDGVVARVSDDGQAAKAGWLKGDRVVEVDGEKVANQAEILERLHTGPSRKTFRLQRGDTTIESVVDYSGSPGEEERAARAARRKAFLEQRAAAGERH